MPNSIEIESPLPGDNVATTFTVAVNYTFTNQPNNAAQDRIECKLITSGGAETLKSSTPTMLALSGTFDFQFTAIAATGYSVRAEQFENNVSLGFDLVEDIDIEAAGGGIIIIGGGVIPLIP